MRVYYNPSLWSRDKSPHGLRQRLNWQFEYGGTKRCIPAIFRFPKGIVFDIITFIDEVKLREFFTKYEDVQERLTPLQRRCAEQQHPYQAVPVKEIWINGKKVEMDYSSSSTLSIPWARQEDMLNPVRKAYSSILKGTACFACERFCVPYTETGSRVKRLMRFLRLDSVKCMKLSTYPVNWFTPLDIHFEICAPENHKEFYFRHPVTGINHTLYFQNIEPVEIPLHKGINHSLYAACAMYEIIPELPKGDTLQFNSSIRYREPSKDRFSPSTASSIGIIGGAAGPTAIFAASKDNGGKFPCGLHGLPLHSCFSVPGFKKEDVLHFVLEGINTEYRDSREYSFK